MDEFLTSLFSRYGVYALVGSALLAFLVWWLAHTNAAPGTRVSVLWGLVEYTKLSKTDSAAQDDKPSPEEAAAAGPAEQIEESRATRRPVILESATTSEDRLEAFMADIRAQQSLREITALESDRPVRSAPLKTYFFVFQGALGIKTRDDRPYLEELGNKPAVRYRTHNHYFEFHKDGGGELFLMAFVTPSDSTRVTNLSGVEKREAVLSPIRTEMFNTWVRVPVSRILSTWDRELHLSESEDHPVLDAVLM